MSELPRVDLALNPEDMPFFDGLDTGIVTVPWCDHCDDHIWPPRNLCVQCYRPTSRWRELPGTGEVYSFSLVHRGEGAFAKADVYVFALVSLDGGPTVMANIVADDPDEVRVGARVRLRDPATRPREAAAGSGRRGAEFVLE